MIRIEFINSPDKNIYGSYRTYKTYLTIGRNKTNDIIISDPEISRKHLTLELTAFGVISNNNNEDKFYLSNEKKISGSKINQKGDKITIGNTSFRITDFEFTEPEDYIKIFKKKEKETFYKRSYLNNIINTLKSELKLLLTKPSKDE